MIYFTKKPNKENKFDDHSITVEVSSETMPEIVNALNYFLLGCGYAESTIEKYFNVDLAESDIGRGSMTEKGTTKKLLRCLFLDESLGVYTINEHLFKSEDEARKYAGECRDKVFIRTLETIEV